METTVHKLEQEKVELETKLQQTLESDRERSKLQESLDKIKEENGVLTSEVEKLRNLIEETKAERDNTNSQVAALSKQLEEIQTKYDEEKKKLEDSQSKYNQETEKRKEEAEKYREEKSQLEKDIEALQSHVHGVSQKLLGIENDKDNLVAQLENEKAEFEKERTSILEKRFEVEAKLAETEVKRSELAKDLAATKKESQMKKEEFAKVEADMVKRISTLEERFRASPTAQLLVEPKEKSDGDEKPTASEDFEKLRSELTEKDSEIFQLHQQLDNKDKLILEVCVIYLFFSKENLINHNVKTKAQIDQSELHKSQLRDDIAEKELQITHLKEEQDIQLKAVTSAAASTNILIANQMTFFVNRSLIHITCRK